jgi:ABC-type nitrate/sulfonate/bicarbonate transport system substrate-binding protein
MYLKLKKILFSVAASLIAAIILAVMPACGRVPEKADQPRKVTVILDWVPNTNHTGIYVAREKGYYSEKGLEVEIIQPTEGGSADLIAADKGEFGISYQEQVTYARTAENPLPIVAVAAIIHHNTSGFASPLDRNIQTPADFEGKKYGGWGSPIEEAMLKGLMEKYNADFSRLEIVNIGASDFFTSVERDVDFTWIYYGWDGVKAELIDFPINFILLQDLDPVLDFYTPVIIVSEDTIKNEPGLVKDFISATRDGYEFTIDNPEESAEIFLDDNPELDPELIYASQNYLSENYVSYTEGWGYMKKDIWENYSSWMYDSNLLENRLEAEEAFTNQFLTE